MKKKTEEIEVHVASYGTGRNLGLTYFDPISGKKVAKSSGTTDRTAAERAAAVWQDELNSGRYRPPSRITWQEFRERYEQERLATLSPATMRSAASALNHVETVLNPDRPGKLTTAALSHFQAELRKPRLVTEVATENGREVKRTVTKPGMRDTTLACHLRHIKAALNWGVSMGLLASAPRIHMPKKAKGQTMMRGRPITAEEFDRLIDAVPKVRPDDPAAWVRYLTGLWLSGLRLAESLTLSWDQDAPFCVDLTGRRPAFRIYAEAHKARRDQMLPMTPDFAEWLQTTPEEDRRGRVFPLDTPTGAATHHNTVGRTVVIIGETAGVVVNKADGKFASAHDLRRAFGTRWAPKVKPATLQLLMRHADISTTMKYYVAQDAADVADELWATHTSNTRPAGNTQTRPAKRPGNTVGNTEADRASDPSPETTQAVAMQRLVECPLKDSNLRLSD